MRLYVQFFGKIVEFAVLVKISPCKLFTPLSQRSSSKNFRLLVKIPTTERKIIFLTQKQY